jgi:hypothetical protein
MREMGASWKIITEDMPEPMGIEPVGVSSPDFNEPRSGDR